MSIKMITPDNPKKPKKPNDPRRPKTRVHPECTGKGPVTSKTIERCGKLRKGVEKKIKMLNK